MLKKLFCAAISGFALLAAAHASQAADMTVTANLTSGAETPPNSSTGTGTLVGTYDAASKKLTYSVAYTGLTGAATAAHFHAPAPAGKAAGVEIPITGALESPIKGETTLTDAQATNLTAGMTYFNVHTAANKAGEIRGQVSVGK